MSPTRQQKKTWRRRLSRARHTRHAWRFPWGNSSIFVVWHRARLVFASALEAAGVSLEVRGLLLGHAASGVTEGSYTVRQLPELARAVAAVSLRWPESTVQGTVQPAQSIDAIPLDSRSHLRDLNSRPTVYETASGTEREGSDRPSRGGKTATGGRTGNGTGAATGPRPHCAPRPRTVQPHLRMASAARAIVEQHDRVWRGVAPSDLDLVLERDPT